MTALGSRLKGIREILHFRNAIQILTNRLLFRDPLSVYRSANLEVLTDHRAGDANGLRMCLTSETYRLLLDKLKLPETPIDVLDIGANAGGFSLLLLKQGIAMRSLNAVEMHPLTYSRLLFNLRHNFKRLSPNTSLHCTEAALTGSTGDTRIVLGAGSTGDSVNTPSPQGEPIQIRTMTFDAFFRTCELSNGTCDLCKIDIEGSEYELLESDTACELMKCKSLIIEIHGKGERREKALLALRQLGFSVVHDIPGNQASVFAMVNPSVGR